MNPILHDLHNKQWVWTAANAKKQKLKTSLNTGFTDLDKVLSGGFPRAGLIHVESPLGCGELRLMLSVLVKNQAESDKLFVFIDPPFHLNAEFLLAHNLPLERRIIIRSAQVEEALWSAEQCAKSGACYSIFLWNKHLKHTQVRKLELASQQGESYCVWLQNHSLKQAQAFNTNTAQGKQHETQTNLPLSLSLSLRRERDELSIKVNKQKVGWAQQAVSVPFPFKTCTNHKLKKYFKVAHQTNNVISINAHR